VKRLVDSSVYIDWLRCRRDFAADLLALVQQGELVGCGIVRLEVIRGIRQSAQKKRLEEFFELIPEILMDPVFWSGAAELAWKLDRAGKVVPTSDVAIAHCALQADAVLVTLDRHFRKIPGLRTSQQL
jgi:predicted nucleic acid-binding protein